MAGSSSSSILMPRWHVGQEQSIPTAVCSGPASLWSPRYDAGPSTILHCPTPGVLHWPFIVHQPLLRCQMSSEGQFGWCCLALYMRMVTMYSCLHRLKGVVLGQNILRIFCRHLVWKADSFWKSFWVVPSIPGRFAVWTGCSPGTVSALWLCCTGLTSRHYWVFVNCFWPCWVGLWCQGLYLQRSQKFCSG